MPQCVFNVLDSDGAYTSHRQDRLNSALVSSDCVFSGNVCVMSTTAISRPNVKPASSPHVDSPEEIAEMMAEAARLDALFQSGAISTLLPSAFTAFVSESAGS
jgi:hypothetical protein